MAKDWVRICLFAAALVLLPVAAKDKPARTLARAELPPGFAIGSGADIALESADITLVGGDVVEVAPQYDATSNTAQIGAQCLFELLALVALARAGERGAPK